MKNKNILKCLLSAVVVLIILITGVSLNSCKKENTTAVAPIVTKFRIVDKDSTIVSAPFGLTIAVIGLNLQDVQEVWFNDLKTALNPNFVTSTTIICAVPNELQTHGSFAFTSNFNTFFEKSTLLYP